MRRGNAIYAPNFVPRQNDNDSLQVPELRALLLRRGTTHIIYDLRIYDVRFIWRICKCVNLKIDPLQGMLIGCANDDDASRVVPQQGGVSLLAGVGNGERQSLCMIVKPSRRGRMTCEKRLSQASLSLKARRPRVCLSWS